MTKTRITISLTALAIAGLLIVWFAYLRERVWKQRENVTIVYDEVENKESGVYSQGGRYLLVLLPSGIYYVDMEKKVVLVPSGDKPFRISNYLIVTGYYPPIGVQINTAKIPDRPPVTVADDLIEFTDLQQQWRKVRILLRPSEL